MTLEDRLARARGQLEQESGRMNIPENDVASRSQRRSIRNAVVGVVAIVAVVGIAVGATNTFSGSGRVNAAAELKADSPVVGTLHITAAPGGQLTFSPDTLNATTGIYRVVVNFAAAGHTFAFHETLTLFKELTPADAGPASGVVFFPTAGDYHFYCTVPGHAEAGMRGIVHVTGGPLTLHQAQVAAALTPQSGK